MKEQNKLEEVSEEELKERLLAEIAETLREWEGAKRYFNYASGQDQIDYAIHAIITSEKRYEMLLRKAKRMDGPWPMWKGEFK